MLVKEIELFGGVAPGVLNEIADICLEEKYSKDTVLFEKGEDAEYLYILKQGVLNLHIKNGGSLNFSLSERGDIFGWSSLVESGRYTASGICATDIEVLKVERDKLEKIFKSHPEVGYIVLKRLTGVISKRLLNAYQQLLSARGKDSTATTPSYG